VDNFALGIVVGIVINLVTALFSRRKALALLPWLLLYIGIHGAYVFLTGNGREFIVKHNQWWIYLIVVVIALLFWKTIIAVVNKIDTATAPAQRGLKMVIALTMINQERDLTASADGARIGIFNDSSSVLKGINQILRFPELKSAEVPNKYKSRARIAGGGKPGSDYMVVEVPELQPSEHVDLDVVFAEKQKVTSIDSWASQYGYAKDYVQVQQGFLGPEHHVEPPK